MAHHAEIKGVDNRAVAEMLRDYVREKKKEAILLPALDAMLNGKDVDDIQGWDWKIAEIIEWNTSYIFIERETDVDFEQGDYGQPLPAGGYELPADIAVHHLQHLMNLRQEVDDLLNNTNQKIKSFLADAKKPKWVCRNCGRFLGKELLSLEEIQKLLKDFVIKKFWKCRSCKLPNYFVFTESSIEFKSENGTST